MRAKKKGENVGWAYQKLNNHTIRPNTLEVPQLHNQACVRWQESSPAGHFSAFHLVGGQVMEDAVFGHVRSRKEVDSVFCTNHFDVYFYALALTFQLDCGNSKINRFRGCKRVCWNVLALSWMCLKLVLFWFFYWESLSKWYHAQEWIKPIIPTHVYHVLAFKLNFF